MPSPCPECGAPVPSAANVLCPKCGYVLRPDAFEKARSTARRHATVRGGGLSRSKRVILYVVAAIAILPVAVVGLAYVSQPWLIKQAVREQEGNAAEALRQLHAAERSYRDQNQAYTGDLEALRAFGWQEPGSDFYAFRVSQAGSDRLCLEADPNPAETDLIPAGPLSMNGDGFLFHRNGCTGDPDLRGSLPTLDP